MEIQTCEKWKKVWITLNEKPEVEGDDVTLALEGILDGRPKGNKKVKAAKKATSATAAEGASSAEVHDELHKMLVETSSRNKEQRARSEAGTHVEQDREEARAQEDKGQSHQNQSRCHHDQGLE
jgi:hypothetical protein